MHVSLSLTRPVTCGHVEDVTQAPERLSCDFFVLLGEAVNCMCPTETARSQDSKSHIYVLNLHTGKYLPTAKKEHSKTLFCQHHYGFKQSRKTTTNKKNLCATPYCSNSLNGLWFMEQ